MNGSYEPDICNDRYSLTRDFNLAPEKAFSAAIDQLYPHASGRQLISLFEGKVAHSTIVNWRAGRRGIPRWAIDRVRVELRQRFEPLDHALEHAKERLGLKAGALNLAKWKARKQP